MYLCPMWHVLNMSRSYNYEHSLDPGIDVEAGEDKYRYSLALAAMHEGGVLQMLLDTGYVFSTE